MPIHVDVVRVFTDEKGHHGNPLGIVDSSTVPAKNRQAVAAKLGYSETIFVELPASGSEHAGAQIFTPTTELPFAGHPTVGLSWWLHERGTPVRTLEVPAGSVATRRSGAITWVRAKAEWAPEFSLYPMNSVRDVETADPKKFGPGHHYLWAWTDKVEHSIRSRMFAPDIGIKEDEATGAAAVHITDHLRHALLITQGRGSQLHTTYDSAGWIEVGGLVRPEKSHNL
ncbi:PhzF family phenazine biosynthesis protein [Rhodococcus marinonascens]|uniref:PhzF family phenazine biosynthesis protein n=1 Tax=Rhodococcus marinonascens TaxID=38311 RepID=UPI00093364BA|nr:PhzF family phenazine biosynthesis protein [Rhodococcus marinonascens]